MSGTESDHSHALGILGGGAGREVLNAALPKGARVRRAKVRTLTGGRTTLLIGYDVVVEWPDGRKARDIMAVAVGEPPEGAAIVEVDGARFGVWLALTDPELPAMRRALDPRWLAELLGISGVGPQDLNIEMPTYIPGRRAVIFVESKHKARGPKLVFTRAGTLEHAQATDRIFVKVVRPHQAEPIVERTRRLSAAVPVPPTSLTSEPGVLVLAALPGRPLGAAVENDAPSAAPPEQVVDLTTRIAALPAEGVLAEPAFGGQQRLDDAVVNLRALLPGEADRLDRIVDAIGPLTPQPPVVVHGDFHTDQVLVERRRITGLLDLDDAGLGEQVDDLAPPVAWLIVRAAALDRYAVSRYAEQLHAEAARVVDPDELRRRVAVAMLERALAAFQGGRPGWQDKAQERIGMAEFWLENQRASGPAG